MASLFGALGSLAQSYGNALELRRQQQQQEQQGALQQLYAKLEQGRLAEEQQRTQIDAARERREALAARRPIALGGTYKVDGKQMQRFWDPDAKGGAGGFIELQEGDVDDPVKEFQRRFQNVHGTLPTPEQVDAAVLGLKPPAAEQGYELKQDRNGRWIYMRKDPTAKGGELVIPSSVIGKLPKEAGEVELPEKTVAALADRWNKYGDTPPAKYRAQVEVYMEDRGMAPGRKLSAQEQRVLDVVKQAEPKVAQLKKLIEDHGLTNENSFVFSNYSGLAQHMRMRGIYRFGVKPDQVAADLIKTAGALQVMGIAPWTVIGRGKYTTEIIQQHLVNPTDTPALLYDKVNFFEGILDDAKESISGAGAIGSSGAGGSARDFGPAPPGKQEGSTGTLPDGTRVVVRSGRLMSQ